MFETKQALTLTLNIKAHPGALTDHLSPQTLLPVIYADDRCTDWSQQHTNGSSYKTNLHSRKGKQSKAKHFQQHKTLFVCFLSVSYHISSRHTHGASNSCKLFEKPSNAGLALRTPDYGHQQQLLRTSLLDFALTLK